MAALLLCLWTAAPVQAQPLADPRLDWLSADSAHFRVHYRSTQRTQAEAVARAAERVYGRVTQALNWEPRGRTEIVVYNEFDLANGFSTPLPFNLMGVFLAPPDDGQLLDNSPWLDLLLVHEFTHTVHLDKVRGAPKILQTIFGRVPWFIPNLFQPGWVLEGLAVYNESDPASGRGRLQGPLFEAWLRAERAAGFIKLAELNADGRALPLSKQYLYGAYFFEFMARRYGADKIGAYVEQYSGNIVPRLHTNPYDMTGKTMDVLWDEFLADLAQQVDGRAAPIRAQPEVLGPKVSGTLFDIPTVSALPGGAMLAVLDDGLGEPGLFRLQADGSKERLADVNRYARLDVAPGGGVLITQPDVCNSLYLAYDVYRLEGSSLKQLTSCAHLRRAVQAGPAIVALQLEGGSTRLVRLAQGEGEEPRVLHTPAAGTDLVDLAASPDGQRVAVISRTGGDWQLLEFDLAQPGAAPRLLLRRNAPMQGLRHGAAGLEVLAAEAGQYNVWRLQGGEFKRLTHSHTAVVAHGGTAADGSLATVVVAPQGYALHRLAAVQPLQSLPVDTSPAPVVAAAPATADAPLGEGSRYAAWRAMYPRAWLPATLADRGLTAYGATTSGADALGWHQYALTAMVETSQKELVGTFEYQFIGKHGIALARTLTARDWTGDKNNEETTVYDRRTQAQWLSIVPFTRLERRAYLGVGAAVDRVDRVTIAGDTTAAVQQEQLVALLADYDSRGENWYSDGPNRGLKVSLLYEDYKPFARNKPLRYDGHLLRADVRGFVPLWRAALALRWTEARASGRTEPFQLGGATDEVLQFGPLLNNRTMALRGYRGGEAVLRGQNARIASAELRMPLADIDRHGMVPPFGINRLSGTLFFEAGGAWSTGNGPDRWRRAVGVELLGETKLLYALGLELRLGLAQALDEPKGTRGYLRVGRAF